MCLRISDFMGLLKISFVCLSVNPARTTDMLTVRLINNIRSVGQVHHKEDHKGKSSIQVTFSTAPSYIGRIFSNTKFIRYGS